MIKSNAGALTPAADPNDTLQGFSLARMEKIIKELQSGTWKPKLCRQVMIPKPGKVEKRPLGIQGGSDKIVQGGVLLILEAIYDHKFSKSSYGFIRDRGTHDALKYLSENGKASTYSLEGDIKSLFPSVHHNRLLEILGEHIQDAEFLKVIAKMLKAGIWDMETNTYIKPLMGTPQRSIVSPILSNIYLDKMDQWMVKWERDNISSIPRKTPKLSKEAERIQSKIQWAQKKNIAKPGSVDPLEIRKLKMDKLKVQAILPESINPRIHYVRYADDFILIGNLNKPTMLRLKQELGEYLKTDLHLTLHADKSKITDLRKEPALFLGHHLNINTSKRIKKVSINRKPTYLKRTTGYELKLRIPKDRIINSLHQKGFCNTLGQPLSLGRITAYEDVDIIAHFSAVYRGITNFYSGTECTHTKYRIRYILIYSCYHTLAHKFRSSVSKMRTKYGPDVKITRKYPPDSRGKIKTTEISFDKVETKSKWQTNHKFEDPFKRYMGKYTRSKIGGECAICQSRLNVEMHHIKTLKNIRPRTFDELFGYVNRKQIPLCRTHHVEVTKGRYNGLDLRHLLLMLP